MAATVQRPGLLEQSLGRKKNFNVQESVTRELHLPATQAPTKSARHVGCTSGGSRTWERRTCLGTTCPGGDAKCAKRVPPLPSPLWSLGS